MPNARWQDRHHDLETLFALFGAPAAIAAQGFFARDIVLLMRDLLALIETLVRKTLLLDALALIGVLKPSLKRVRARKNAKAEEVSVPDPTKWRVSFHAIPPQPSRRPSARITSIQRRHCDAYPPAARLEALRRVIAIPLPAARRLARRLGGKAARAIAVAINAARNFRADPRGWMSDGLQTECESASARAVANSS